MTNPDTNEPIVIDGRACKFVQCDSPINQEWWAIKDVVSSNSFLRDDGRWIEWMHAPLEVRCEMNRFRWLGREAAEQFARSVAARSQDAENPPPTGQGQADSRHVRRALEAAHEWMGRAFRYCDADMRDDYDKVMPLVSSAICSLPKPPVPQETDHA